MSKKNTCSECNNPFCKSLSPKSKEKVCTAKLLVNYPQKRQQVFFLENKQVVILKEGVVIPVRTNTKIQQQSIDLMTAGDLLGMVNLFSGEERESFSILPLIDSIGCMISSSIFEQLIHDNADIAEATIKSSCNRYSRVVDNFMRKSLGSSEERIIYAISMLQKAGITSATHETIALLSGMNRVTVTKKMSSILREKNIDFFYNDY